MTEKRSIDGGFAQRDLFGDGQALGVGARQGRRHAPAGGGGYQKIRGAQNFRIPDDTPPDPRFAELEKIGIGGPWLRLARRVGFDTFLEIWRAISEDEGARHDGGRRMPKLREYSAYTRYQRNQYVRSLAATGMTPQQVRKLVEKNLGERLSIPHIQGLIKGRFDRAEPAAPDANSPADDAGAAGRGPA